MQTQKTSKRILFVLLSLLPLVAAFILQFIVSLICILFIVISRFVTAGSGSMTNLYSFLLSSQFNTQVMLLFALLTIPLTGMWYRIAAVPKYMQRRSPGQIINLQMLAALVLMVAALQFLCNYLVIFLAYIKPEWYNAYSNLFKSAGVDDKTLIFIIYSSIAAPISEELIFRGVTLHFASKALPFWAANILQAALFGLYHMNFVQSIYAFLIGLFLGYICYYGQSIYLSIGFHMMFNLWSTLFDNFMYYGNNLLLHIMQFALSILAAAAGICLYLYGTRRRRRPFNRDSI